MAIGDDLEPIVTYDHRMVDAHAARAGDGDAELIRPI
jgi:hypothetical protein